MRLPGTSRRGGYQEAPRRLSKAIFKAHKSIFKAIKPFGMENMAELIFINLKYLIDHPAMRYGMTRESLDSLLIKLPIAFKIMKPMAWEFIAFLVVSKRLRIM
jgi:hypothetical protein